MIQLSRARDRVSAIGSAGQFVQQLVVGVCMLALLWLGLRALQTGVLSGPVWVGLLLGALGLFEVLGPLMRGAARLGVTAAAGVRVRALLRTEPAMTDADSTLALPASGVLELADIRYDYPGGSRALVLDGLNLRVDPGEHIAIVGASGSGKSTLLSVIMRLFDPASGVVSYGAVPINRVKIAVLHKRFTLLSQNSPVFFGTLRSNLLIGNPDATDSQLWQALERAGLADFVQSLKAGLDLWVGESGRSLSVGQARRLCLARALLTSATVWVLDEPTAGLDAQAQDAFFSDLRHVAAGRTVVLVTHADIPAAAVDRIVRLSAGTLHDCPIPASVPMNAKIL
jgi:ATP-binding cassette subfamily C protein CydC